MSVDGRARLGRRREPAVAGTFYAGDPERLERDVAALLDLAHDAHRGDGAPDGFRGQDATERLIGLLVPHAGLMYSGAVAAVGWSRLAEWAAGSSMSASSTAASSGPPTILLAGTNHFHPFEGIAVWSGGAWATPIADVTVDGPWSDVLLALGGPFVSLDRAHAREHSIEVQLPILARALPGARFVPFLVSLGDPLACIEAGRRLGRAIRERTQELGPVVVVASSDLAHYPPDAVAREVDATVLEPIAALDPRELAARELEIRDAGLPGLACGLCGIEPTVLTLAAVAELGATRGVVLAHATSADVPAGDRGRVVGYAAVAFVG